MGNAAGHRGARRVPCQLPWTLSPEVGAPPQCTPCGRRWPRLSCGRTSLTSHMQPVTSSARRAAVAISRWKRCWYLGVRWKSVGDAVGLRGVIKVVGAGSLGWPGRARRHRLGCCREPPARCAFHLAVANSSTCARCHRGVFQRFLCR